MSDLKEKESESSGTREGTLSFSLEAVPSTLQTTGGREVNFTRARLVLRNDGYAPAVDLIPRAAIVQEEGLSQDITETLMASLSDKQVMPGTAITWDLYDLLVAGHPGVSSKVHLFGYKAVLNWWFDLSVQAEYRLSGGGDPVRTAMYRVTFRWNAVKPSLDTVDLSIEPR